MNFMWNLDKYYVYFLYEKMIKSNIYESYVKILYDFDMIFMWILYYLNFEWYLCKNKYLMFFICFMVIVWYFLSFECLILDVVGFMIY